MINIVESFISDDEIQRLLDLAMHCSWLDNDGMGVWRGRSYPLFLTPEIMPLAIDLRKRIENQIYLTENKHLVTDVMTFARWNIGHYQNPHADAENISGEPHPYPWREYGCVLYLNDNYRGGSIFFPQHNLNLRPKPGTLVYFPGTIDYLHGVNEVSEGTRYTLNTFWTSDDTKKCKVYYDESDS